MGKPSTRSLVLVSFFPTFKALVSLSIRNRVFDDGKGVTAVSNRQRCRLEITAAKRDPSTPALSHRHTQTFAAQPVAGRSSCDSVVKEQSSPRQESRGLSLKRYICFQRPPRFVAIREGVGVDMIGVKGISTFFVAIRNSSWVKVRPPSRNNEIPLNLYRLEKIKSLRARELRRFLFPGLYRLELRAQGHSCEATASVWRTSDRVIKDAKLPCSRCMVFLRIAKAQRGSRNKNN